MLIILKKVLTLVYEITFMVKFLKCRVDSWAVVAQAFNPSIWEPEAGRSLSSRPAWSTKQVPGWPGLHRETLILKKSK